MYKTVPEQIVSHAKVHGHALVKCNGKETATKLRDAIEPLLSIGEQSVCIIRGREVNVHSIRLSRRDRDRSR